MKTYPMRCKHCGGLLDVKASTWQRLVHGTAPLTCSHCNKITTRADALAMGTCFGARVEALEGQLIAHVKGLPVLSAEAAAVTLGATEDQLRVMPGLDTLCSYVLHMFRPVVLEQAHGRDVEVAVVGMNGAAGGEGGEAAVGVMGMVEDEKGVRQWEAMIARVGPARFVVHATAGGDGPVGEPSRRHERVVPAARGAGGHAAPSTPVATAAG